MTNTIKYSIGVLALLLILFFGNQSSQKSYDLEGEPIYSGSKEKISRIVISENDDTLELVRSDTTWSITQAGSLKVKDLQIGKFFDRLLTVEQEMLISSKSEKWEKFGVDDSLGRHLQVFDENNNELLHYIFGNSGQDYQHNYIRQNRSNNVYRTNDNVYFLLNTSTTYWGEKPKIPEPEKVNEN
ncbi:MAG: DUF4340 domain-containing protein [Candidatus Marinimicrobia bacterium]|jgi:hypothetical protein|nr:DUF4340 domain-containing protein [Candidatus Neomarinimicrobiota bacterium]|tara:strand:+ start:4179 stop:4733 length:555 start_codon:yes stop_codon:yes gene_type:complete